MYATYLKHLLVWVFDEAFDPGTGKFRTEAQLAKAAKLHQNTVWRLRTGRTKDPKHQTIWKLLKTVGIDHKLVMSEMAEMLA
jgi:transcriptional regulator with XRE-family HTH domain